MRSLTLPAVLATVLALPASADMVFIQQGPAPFALPAPQASAFGMAEAFIRDTVVNRMPWGSAGVVVQQGIPHAPPIPIEDREASEPIPFAGGWQVTEIMDDEGRPLEVDADLLSLSEFNVDLDGAFTAYAGCNRIFGQIEMRNGLVASAEYGMTMMACPGPVGDFERAMMRVLDSASLVAIGPEMLVLLDGEGDKLAEFALRFDAP